MRTCSANVGSLMSKPVLKNINFGTVNLEAYSPEIPHNFCVWLTLLIGPAGAEGGHLYLYVHLVGAPVVQGAGLLFKKHAACGKF